MKERRKNTLLYNVRKTIYFITPDVIVVFFWVAETVQT